MARIVITAWGTYGDLFPALGVARELKRRGHVPVLATCAYYREIVEREGIFFMPCRPNINPDDKALAERVMDPWRGAEAIFKEIILPAVRDSHADMLAVTEGADLVLSHPVAFAARIAAETRGLPWLSFVLAPISMFSAHDPALPPGAPWLRHVLRWGPRTGRLFRALARSITGRWFQPLHELRSELGLPAIGNPVFEGQFSPFGTLALFSPVIGPPQPDWPMKSTATGFVRFNHEMTLAPEVEAFLSAGDAPIVFTLGSSAIFVARQFYEESIGAARLAGRRAVLLAGPGGAERLAPLLTTNELAVDYAPHHLLFPRAAVIVHQAGVGTLAEGLRSGRPTLIVPHANDQPDNAYRAERLGCARVLMPTRYRAARAAQELHALLEDPAYVLRAANIRTTMGDEDGAVAACNLIERCLATIRPQ
jgi:rhamnosyltransferase subunit B